MSESVILVVDDEPMNYKLLRAILEHEGYSIDYAADGFKAVEMAKNSAYKLAIMDVRLPGIDGIETSRRIKQINPTIKIVGSSVSDINPNYVLFDYYLQKPISRSQLLEIVRACAN
ncbi:MAG: response regulator [Bacteroidales bacterium]|nr:response regulator [Bacteroidales bacterium]